MFFAYFITWFPPELTRIWIAVIIADCLKIMLMWEKICMSQKRVLPLKIKRFFFQFHFLWILFLL